ncbi:MAG: arylsulfatase [Bacteroidota bacterium]
MPNIVFIFADDLGYGDLGSYNPNSLIPTPNLDKLASEGISLTNAYCPVSVCSPSRYALMTGTYPWRSWNKSGVLQNYEKSMMEPGQLTLPQMLKKAGYVTAGFGKWHLGAQFPTLDGEEPVGYNVHYHPENGANIDLSKPVFDGPIDHGFDHWVGFSCASECWVLTDKMVTGTIDHDFYTTEKTPNQDHIQHFGLDEYLPYVTGETLKFLENHVNNEVKPFFLYYSPYVPHLPLAPGADYKGSTDAGTYGDYVHELDARIGDILKFIEEKNLSDNTLIMFASDNGSTFKVTSSFIDTSKATNNPTMNNAGLDVEALIASDSIPIHQPNGKLKGLKASIWEGGVRTPFIAKWSGHIQEGKKSDALFALNDVLPTLAEIVDYELSKKDALDGFDISPVLFGTGDGNRKSVVVQSANNIFGFRKGNFKFVMLSDTLEKCVLYDLGSDVSEERNLIASQSDLAESLRNELLTYIP